MKKTLFCLAAVLAALSAGCSAGTAQTPESVKPAAQTRTAAAPGFRLKQLGAGTVAVSPAQDGALYVLNFWATWCPPCVREMPVLHAAQVDNPAVNFVFINQGESAERVSHWLAARNLPLRNVLLDRESQALKAFEQRGLPTTLFFDAKEQLVSTRTGELSAATLAEKLGSID